MIQNATTIFISAIRHQLQQAAEYPFILNTFWEEILFFREDLAGLVHEKHKIE